MGGCPVSRVFYGRLRDFTWQNVAHMKLEISAACKSLAWQVAQLSLSFCSAADRYSHQTFCVTNIKILAFCVASWHVLSNTVHNNTGDSAACSLLFACNLECTVLSSFKRQN